MQQIAGGWGGGNHHSECVQLWAGSVIFLSDSIEGQHGWETLRRG